MAEETENRTIAEMLKMQAAGEDLAQLNDDETRELLRFTAFNEQTKAEAQALSALNALKEQMETALMNEHLNIIGRLSELERDGIVNNFHEALEKIGGTE